MGPQTIDHNTSEVLLEFFLVFVPVLLVYAICIWQAGALALRRGRSRRKWTFRAVLFGPLALLVLALLPSRRNGIEARSRHRRTR